MKNLVDAVAHPNWNAALVAEYTVGDRIISDITADANQILHIGCQRHDDGIGCAARGRVICDEVRCRAIEPFDDNVDRRIVTVNFQRRSGRLGKPVRPVFPWLPVTVKKSTSVATWIEAASVKRGLMPSM